MAEWRCITSVDHGVSGSTFRCNIDEKTFMKNYCDSIICILCGYTSFSLDGDVSLRYATRILLRASVVNVPKDGQADSSSYSFSVRVSRPFRCWRRILQFGIFFFFCRSRGTDAIIHEFVVW